MVVGNVVNVISGGVAPIEVSKSLDHWQTCMGSLGAHCCKLGQGCTGIDASIPGRLLCSMILNIHDHLMQLARVGTKSDNGRINLTTY